MQRATRNDFLWRHRAGIELDNPDLKKQLASAPDLAKGLDACDKNKDGVIQGRRELRGAFRYLEKLASRPPLGRAGTTGAAATLLGAITAGTRKMPDFGMASVNAAIRRVGTEGANYAYEKSPTSPHPQLS